MPCWQRSGIAIAISEHFTLFPTHPNEQQQARRAISFDTSRFKKLKFLRLGHVRNPMYTVQDMHALKIIVEGRERAVLTSSLAFRRSELSKCQPWHERSHFFHVTSCLSGIRRHSSILCWLSRERGESSPYLVPFYFTFAGNLRTNTLHALLSWLHEQFLDPLHPIPLFWFRFFLEGKEGGGKVCFLHYFPVWSWVVLESPLGQQSEIRICCGPSLGWIFHP